LPREGMKVLSLERTLLYGGKSMFAPIFYGHDYRIREASPESAYERGAYNFHMLDDRFMEYGKPAGIQYFIKDMDLILVPNALHHIPIEGASHHILFQELAGECLRPGGYLYIFEQFIEEIHQKPDDYVRYTPSGLASLLEAAGYKIEWVRQTGNIYTSIAFLLDQVQEYIEGTPTPPDMKPLDFGLTKGEAMRKVQGMIRDVGRLAPSYPHNGLRSHTECPKAFSVLARKPV
jgi:hypothetical protein